MLTCLEYLNKLSDRLMELIESSDEVNFAEGDKYSTTLYIMMSKFPRDMRDFDDKILKIFKTFFETVDTTYTTHDRILLNVLQAFNAYVVYHGVNQMKQIINLGDELCEKWSTIWRKSNNDLVKVVECREFTE